MMKKQSDVLKCDPLLINKNATLFRDTSLVIND